MRNTAKTLTNWRLLLELLMPVAVIVGLYYGLKSDIASSQAQMGERISKVELESEKSFADKSSLDQIRNDVNDIKLDVKEIKTLLKRQN